MDKNKQNLQIAIVDSKSGVHKSARKVMLVYGVPLSILSD